MTCISIQLHLNKYVIKREGSEVVLLDFPFSHFMCHSPVEYRALLCATRMGPELPSLKVTITCKEHGRYVIFYNERLRGMTYPSGYELENVFTELCEVTEVIV